MLTMLALLIALLATASTSAKTTTKIPSCARISRTAMAKLAGTGPLRLKKVIGNLCEFKGDKPGHYPPVFTVQIIPYRKSIWSTALADAMKTKDATFGRFNSKLFFTTATHTSAGLQPCQPGQKLEPGGPACAGQPNATGITVIGHGSDKRISSQLMVSAGAVAQQGDIHLSHFLSLVKDIISGKIH